MFPMALRFEIGIVNPFIKIYLISPRNGFKKGSRFWWGSKQTGTEPITHTSFTELRVSFEEIFQLNVYCPVATDRRVKWLLAIPTVYIDKIKWTPLRFLWSLSLSIPTVFTYHNFFLWNISSSMMRLKYERNCYINPVGKSASLGPRYMIAPSSVSLVIFLSIKAHFPCKNISSIQLNRDSHSFLISPFFVTRNFVTDSSEV